MPFFAENMEKMLKEIGDTKNPEDFMMKFMGQFGQVVELAEVKDYDETISLSKDIYDLEMEVKELQLKENSEGTKPERAEKIETKNEEIDQIYKELVKYED